MAGYSPERKARIAARAAELIAEEFALGGSRMELENAHEQVAEKNAEKPA